MSPTDHPDNATGWPMPLVSPKERQMPDTLIKNLRAEIDQLKRYCTSQIALMQRELKDEQTACIRRHQEIRELIAKLESANIDFKRQSAAHSAKVTSLIKQLMRRKDPCDE